MRTSPHILALCAVLLPAVCAPVWAATPAEGTLSDTSRELEYDAGPFLVRNPSAGAIVTDEVCADPALPCDIYTLTVDLSPAYLAAHPDDIIVIQWRWPNPFEDYDYRIFDGNGDIVTTAGTASDPENAIIGAHNGTYTIRGIPFTVFGGSFHATLKLATAAEAPVPPAPAGQAPEYVTVAPPAGVGDSEGEPSIGFNPLTHKIMFYGAGAQTLRGTFPEELAAPLPEVCDIGWEDVSSPLITGTVSSVAGADPILFTDQATGRTFVSNLNIPIPVPPTAVGLNSQFEYTTDDGDTWIPGQIGPPTGGYDHQTVGSGPYPAALSALAVEQVNGGSAVYYCSQAGFTAFCSRSDDGGLTFNTGFPIYNAQTDGFGGIHGHVKVAPDGAVYVPVKACGDQQCVTESDDGGVTWQVRRVPDTSPGPSDPSVGIASDGTLYFCYVNGDGHPHVTLSHDKGLSWQDDYDIGAAHHIVNSVFPEAVAGDPDRAACAFIGTTQGGNYQALDFPGDWYGFVATTYDSGASWHSVNVTPEDPVQHESGVWLGGGSQDNRNLLDFNEITLDHLGNALFGFADGCIGECVTGASNSFTSKATVSRQIGGKPLVAANDPAPSSPRAACLSGQRDLEAAHLAWRVPSTGGSAITAYHIFRSADDGPESLLGETAKARYDDFTAKADVEKYRYRVTAVNALGEGVHSNPVELVAVPVSAETSCSLPGITLFTDGPGDNTGGVPGQDLAFTSIAEPEDMPGKLVLTMKVDTLSPQPPPGTRWATYYDAPDGSGVQRYVAMVTTTGVPSFEYGVKGTAGDTVGTYTPDGTPDPESTYNADGTIVIVLDKATLGFVDGSKITGLQTVVRSSSAADGAGLTVDDTGVAEYTLRGIEICSAAAPTPPPPFMPPDVPSAPPVVVPQDNNRFGGGLGLGLLLPLMGLGLVRRRSA
ncbi:MAG TPA: hypothetical protein VM074_09205 [Solimonas sp.]|nr:hypothetical protein [Solimonas sp.]